MRWPVVIGSIVAVVAVAAIAVALIDRPVPSLTASVPTSTTTTVQSGAPAATLSEGDAEPVTHGGEGEVNLLVNAKSRFDPWTESPSVEGQMAMRSLYDWMVVYSPYFDERLDWYPNGLAYIDLYAIYKNTERDTRSEEHPDWVLKDADDNWLFVDWGCEDGTCPQWAADIGNPDFQEDFLERIGALIAKGYPGVAIDDVNLTWRVSDGSGETVIPIDPRTGEEMLLEDWKRYAADLVELVRVRFPEAKIMHNAIWYADSPDFSDESVRRQTGAADWIMLERGAVDSGLEGGDGKYSLAAFMDFIDMAHEEGAAVLLLDEDATSLEQQIYNLAVYFLVSSGDDLVSTEDYPVIAHDSIWQGLLIDLGDSVGERYRWEGLWRRDFTGGVVLVNDPQAPTREVRLVGAFTTIDGESVTTATLAESQAVVLLIDS